MNKKIFLLIYCLFLTLWTYASEPVEKCVNIDDAIKKASNYASSECIERETILLIGDFDSPSEKMTNYIRNNLKAFLSKEKNIEVAFRQGKAKKIIEDELEFQNSGKIKKSTIVNSGSIYGASVAISGKFEKANSSNKIIIEIYSLEKRLVDTQIYIFPDSIEISNLLGIPYRPAALGFGAELNLNTLDADDDLYSYAASFSFDYVVFRKFSLGLKINASNVHKIITNTSTDLFLVAEPLALLRFYIKSPFTKEGDGTGLFIGLMGGVTIYNNYSGANNNSDLNILPNGGVGLGFRIPIKSFYIEPEIRAGYPYLFGAGVNLGFRF